MSVVPPQVKSIYATSNPVITSVIQLHSNVVFLFSVSFLINNKNPLIIGNNTGNKRILFMDSNAPFINN